MASALNDSRIRAPLNRTASHNGSKSSTPIPVPAKRLTSQQRATSDTYEEEEEEEEGERRG